MGDMIFFRVVFVSVAFVIFVAYGLFRFLVCFLFVFYIERIINSRDGEWRTLVGVYVAGVGLLRE